VAKINWHYVWFRTNEQIREKGYTWDKVCRGIPIPMKTWMSGIPTEQPTEKEIELIAKFLNVSYDYLMYGRITDE